MKKREGGKEKREKKKIVKKEGKKREREKRKIERKAE